MTDNLQEIMQIGGGDGRSGSDEEDEDLSDDYDDEEGYFDEEGYYDGSDGEGSSGEDDGNNMQG